jgi:hypothetical protein
LLANARASPRLKVSVDEKSSFSNYFRSFSFCGKMLCRVASSAFRALRLVKHAPAIPLRSFAMGMAAKKSSAEDVAKASALDVVHTTSIVVSVKHNVPGALLRILSPFHHHSISISKIESRPSRSPSWDFDFLMTFEGSKDDPSVKSCISSISQHCHSLTILGSHHTPWFPRTIKDLDRYADRKLEYGGDLEEDHPGFVDPLYRARRSEITQNAVKHRSGMQLPHVKCVLVQHVLALICFLLTLLIVATPLQR